MLIRVAAAGINNTDVNTRIGWYSKAVTTETAAVAAAGFDAVDDADATWSGTALEFPRIQGADVCGRIVDVGEGVPRERIGERVLVRNMLRTPVDYRPFECWTFGSECDGGFAQFTVAPSAETYAVRSDLQRRGARGRAVRLLDRGEHDAPSRCRVGAGAGDRRLGRSRTRGGAAARNAGVPRSPRCARPTKAADVLAQGADHTVDRGADLIGALGSSIRGRGDRSRRRGQFSPLLDLLRLGGRYAIAGAIGGPIAEIDLRTLYFKDLSLLGCTFQEDEVFENLIEYVERGEVRPVVSRTYRLDEIVRAQEDFLKKDHVGKLV